MFSWLLRLIESFQAVKKRKAVRNQRKIKRKERLDKLSNITKPLKPFEKNGGSQEKNVEDLKKKSKLERAKLWVIRIVRMVVQFIESVIMWLISILGIHITLLLFAAIVLLIVIMSILSTSDNDILDSNLSDTPPISSSSSYIGSLNWTIEELNLYKNYLTVYEQNLFKIAILTKDSINGYGVTDEYKKVKGQNVEDLLFKMSLGVQTTETGWKMYKNVSDRNKLDVFVNPSDVDMVGDIQGPYQMGSSWKFSNVKPEIQAKIKERYSNPLNGGDRHYYPYATAISVLGTYNKMNEQGLNKPKYTEIFKRVAPSFGITSDYERFEAEAIVMLMQMAYLSAPSSETEREGICAFLAGVWAMSSDDPSKRSFQNYSLDFTEGLDLSTANHQQFFGVGSGGGFTLNVPKEKGDLKNLTFGLKKTIKLNGEHLSKPLVAEVVTRYWDIPEIQTYNSVVLSYSHKTDNTQKQFVLRGIYGLESYLVGRQITEYLASKLPVRILNIQKGVFQETPGVGQGDWGGKTIEELSAGNSGAMKFQPYWGTSDDLKYGLMTEWRENDIWGVPFYYQSRKYDTYPISYGVINWYHDGSKRLNACAYYMSAYIASALTGRMINSAEMASALIVTGGVDSRGLYMNDGARVTFDLLGINFRQFNSTKSSKEPKAQAEALKSFGLSIKDESNLWKDRWYYIDEILSQGGLVGVSVNGSSVFTNEGHYMVITGKDAATGKYSIYTSSSTKQTQTLYDRSAFDGKLRTHGYFFAKLK